MTRKLATREAVFAAADALHAQGVEVTIEKVTAQTGGSYSTVGPHLNAWFEEMKTRPTQPVPFTVEKLCASLGSAVWAEALREVQHQIDTTTNRAARVLEQAKTALASAIASNVTFEQSNFELSKKLDEKNARIAVLQLEIDRAQPPLDDLKQAQKLAEERLADNHALKQRIAQLEGGKQVLEAQIQQLLALIPTPRKSGRPAVKPAAKRGGGQAAGADRKSPRADQH